MLLKGVFKLAAVIYDGYIFYAIAQDPEFSNNGHTITYTELGLYDDKDITYYSTPQKAIISNCPIRLLEYNNK